MRDLEATWAAEHCHTKTLLRPPAAYAAATMLIDASQRSWKVLYLNSEASAKTGACTDDPRPERARLAF